MVQELLILALFAAGRVSDIEGRQPELVLAAREYGEGRLVQHIQNVIPWEQGRLHLLLQPALQAC